MQRATHTPAQHHYPHFFKPEDVEARRVERERMKGECTGYSPAVRAALAWVIAATEPSAKASRLYMWSDHQLWTAARAAFAKNPKALDAMPDAVALRITYGEAIAVYNGLNATTCEALPTGADPYEIMNEATPGLGTAVKCLVFETDVHPFSELRWKLTSTPEDPYRPTFTNWFCLPWQGL